MGQIDLQEFQKEYDEIKVSAEKFSNELVRHLNDLVEKSEVYLSFPISTRVKSWDSIENKLQRMKLGQLKLKINRVTDFQDIVGVRIILLFPRDVLKVSEMIKGTFRVLREYNTRDKQKEDQFGYTSNHLIIEFPESWFTVPLMSSFKGLKAEIQVRTLSQHLWAEASHTLQYKNEQNVPAPLRRSIFRVSALLETVDFEFDRVLLERDNYREKLAQEDISDVKLDTDSLEFILDTLLPELNKEKGHENYSELLHELIHFKIDTVAKLKSLIDETTTDILAIDKSTVEKRKKSKIFQDEDEKNRVNSGVFFNHTGLVRQALDQKFGREWRAVFSS